MGSAGFLAIIAVCLGAESATAQGPTLERSSCPPSPLVAPVLYERLHQIPTTPDRDDFSHKMVTPGGMLLDMPKMVAATDVLTIVTRDQAAVCFGLLTYARERHKCELSGIARKEMGDSFLFREVDVGVRLTFLAGDQIRVEPVGTGYRRQCESFGEIQSATYMRR